MQWKRQAHGTATIFAAWLAMTMACSAGDGRDSTEGELTSSGASNGSSSGNGQGADDGFGGSGPGSSSSGSGGACTAVAEQADTQIQASDIILAIDQSGSMDMETSWVTNQLNGFAQQIMASGIDVQVVVIAGPPGSENGFCVPAPLGSGGCPDDDNLPALLHVKQHVDSHDALLQILAKYPDYAQMMRPGASKHVVVITDDDSSMGAAQFDAQLKALDPQFASYVFHSIASSEDDPGSWDCSWNPEPCCDVSADEGKVYKQLVAMTQGVFGDLCLQDFQPVWDQLSTQVIQNATLACEWDIPAPPDGQVLDPNLVNVQHAINGGPLAPLGHVASAAECDSVSAGWYYDDNANPTKIIVCPDVCQLVQGADSAEMSIEFGCQTTPATPK